MRTPDSSPSAILTISSPPGRRASRSTIERSSWLGLEPRVGPCLPSPVTDTAFLVDDGLIDETPLEGYAPTPGGNVWQAWLVHARTPGETWFTIDEGEIDVDPIEGFVPLADLECLLRRHSPAHTDLYVSYALS